MSDQPLTRCDFDVRKLILRLDVTLAAETKAVNDLIDRIMQTVTEIGCATGKEDDVRLALDEALTNAVVHGCGKDPAKTIQCSVACDQSRGMLIIIRDPGPGFDPTKVPSPIIGKNLFATHGRGVFLINQMVDEVRYERGGTEIHMRIK